MMQGPCAAPQIKVSFEGAGDVVFCLLYSGRQCFPLGQMAGNGRGKRAAGAMGVAGLNPQVQEKPFHSVGAKKARYITLLE